jgi:hypothetical protein
VLARGDTSVPCLLCRAPKPRGLLSAHFVRGTTWAGAFSAATDAWGDVALDPLANTCARAEHVRGGGGRRGVGIWARLAEARR